MRLLAILILLAAVGCDNTQTTWDSWGSSASYKVEYPTVNLPYKLRQRNWLGPQGEGSCVHATMVSLLRWQGHPKLADWWRRNNGDGEWDTDLAAKFTRAKVRFAFTSERGDIRFLEWACRTRRGCGVTVRGARHMVALVHLDEKWAGILDNNQTERIIWVPRDTFLSEWLNSNSWAVTPVYTPAPPLP